MEIVYVQENADPTLVEWELYYADGIAVTPIHNHEVDGVYVFRAEEIDKFLWTYEDGDEWMCMCTLKNGAYMFYSGWQDKGGIDAGAMHSVKVALDPRILIREMTDYEYRIYSRECMIPYDV